MDQSATVGRSVGIPPAVRVLSKKGKPLKALKMVQEVKPDLMISHAPGHGFITDLKADRICVP